MKLLTYIVAGLAGLAAIFGIAWWVVGKLLEMSGRIE